MNNDGGMNREKIAVLVVVVLEQINAILDEVFRTYASSLTARKD